jgi:two-component system response regulator MprA
MMPRILVADDDPAILSLLATRLAFEGFEVLQASDAMQAYTTLRRGHFDLVLTDLFAGSLQGPGTELQLLRALAGGTPIILMTGRRDIDDAEPFRYGLAAILHKPFEFKSLLTVLQLSLPTE